MDLKENCLRPDTPESSAQRNARLKNLSNWINKAESAASTDFSFLANVVQQELSRPLMDGLDEAAELVERLYLFSCWSSDESNPISKALEKAEDFPLDRIYLLRKIINGFTRFCRKTNNFNQVHADCLENMDKLDQKGLNFMTVRHLVEAYDKCPRKPRTRSGQKDGECAIL